MRRLFLTLLAALCVAGTAAAQDFPIKPITLLVTFAPGGTSDTLARLVASALTTQLKQTVIVENVAGAGGLVGMQRLLKSAPDGHTLVFNNQSLAILPYLHPTAGFDPLRDIEPVGIVATVPMVLGVSNASGIKDLPALVAYMKKNPRRANFGSGGPGSTAHLAEVLFVNLSKTEAEMVQYRGSGPALADLMAGTIDVVIDQTVTILPLHKDGRVRAIAVTGDKRLPQNSDIPTFAEGGVPEFDLAIWNGVVAPKGTPRPVIDKLSAALTAVMAAPEFKSRLDQLAAQAPSTAEQGPAPFKDVLAADVKRISALSKAGAFAVGK